MNTIETVKELLSNYRQNKSILEEKKKAHDCMKQLLKYNYRKPNENKEDAISGMCMQAPVASHIPRSITNKFNSKTENAVFGYEDELKPNRFNKQKILESMAEVTADIHRLVDEISLADNLVSSLNEKDKFIIETYYLQGYSNAECNFMYNKQFLYAMEHRSLQKKKKKAIEEMGELLKRMEGSK